MDALPRPLLSGSDTFMDTSTPKKFWSCPHCKKNHSSLRLKNLCLAYNSFIVKQDNGFFCQLCSKTLLTQFKTNTFTHVEKYHPEDMKRLADYDDTPQDVSDVFEEFDLTCSNCSDTFERPNAMMMHVKNCNHLNKFAR